MFSPSISFPWKSFLWRIIVPTMLAIALFVSAIFAIIIPAIEKNSMERKKEMIRELTKSAWNILAKLENDERMGILTREEAQQQAVEQIRNLHYGQEMKDYFWINDMQPRMVIHPYRTDLDGRDLSDYKDPDGKYVFLEFVRIVKKQGSGYVYYKWQSHDLEDVILPKISYVKGFAPWQWIIGTGIYIEDIEEEISEIIHNIILISVFILFFIGLLFTSIIRQSYLTHKRQREAEIELKKTQSSLALAEKMASLGKLSAMVAHEINNPLSGILSYARVSSRYLEKEEIKSEIVQSLKDNMSIIAKEAKRCGDIVKNLLLFAKRNVGKISDVHLNEIIDVSTKIIDHSAKMKELELITELDSGSDLIQGDAGAIQQIFVSMIANSIEASSKGNKIIIKTFYDDMDTVTIKIIDHGEGIPVDIQPHIFEPFFSTKESNKSLGLGLSAVYGIVQRHSGEIHVNSSQEDGTVFTIKIPRTQKKLQDDNQERSF